MAEDRPSGQGEEAMSEFVGYRAIQFSDELTTRHGWDVAWDLDSIIKTLDRPKVARILPVLRLTQDGHMTTTEDQTGRRMIKTLATFYSGQDMLIKAIYDPNFNSPEYRYRTVTYNVNAFTGVTTERGETGYRDLRDLLGMFAKNWADTPNPLHLAFFRSLKRADIPVEYKSAGYGLWG